jgi:hypothetical protein
MKSTEADVIQQSIDVTMTEIDSDHLSGIDKKSYTRPVLTKYGKASKLTAAISGSDTDTLGGNQF